MRVLNWVQTRPHHGAHCSKKASEFSAGSAPPVADASSEPCQQDDRRGGRPTAAAMLSIGTFGVGEVRRDELRRLQEELTLLMRSKSTEDEVKTRHLRLSRSLNEGMAKRRSLRKLVSSVFHGFLPRHGFRETTPALRAAESPWPFLNKGTRPENQTSSKATIRSHGKVQMSWTGNAMGEDDEERSKWIRTDSEYIVLEI